MRSKVVDTGNNLFTCANRTASCAIAHRTDDIGNFGFKFLSAITTFEEYFFTAFDGNFRGRKLVFAAPHSCCFRALRRKVIDARDNLFTCASRATRGAFAYSTNNTLNYGFEFLPTIRANKSQLPSASSSNFKSKVLVFFTQHCSNLRSNSRQIVFSHNQLLTTFSGLSNFLFFLIRHLNAKSRNRSASSAVARVSMHHNFHVSIHDKFLLCYQQK